ncbi:MAG: hypothetical protein FWD46_04580 [Cystobacterineae bacterium]|nr:hypothetical protein [Cystobacterineae bacterium]
MEKWICVCCIFLLSAACKTGKTGYEHSRAEQQALQAPVEASEESPPVEPEEVNEQTLAETGYGSPQVEQEWVDEQSFRIREYAADKTYGYSKKNPIMVGGAHEYQGPQNERRFLNALTGPKGEPIRYQRLGSCCPFYTRNGLIQDGGLLDMYEVSYEGLAAPVILYINMYDSDVLKVPLGFELKNARWH